MYSCPTFINPSNVAASPFAHGAVVPQGYSLVITAGQIGTVDDDGTVPELYEEQVAAAIKNLGYVLEAANAHPKDIIKLTYYIVDYGKFHPLHANCNISRLTRITLDVARRSIHINALAKFLGGHKPATALIGVSRLAHPKLKFEIEALAAVRNDKAVKL